MTYKVPPYLHVHGQKHPHEDVRIVANEDALVLLIKALLDALPANSYEDVRANGFFTGDGEGFSVRIHLDNNAENWAKLRETPYTVEGQHR